MSKKVRVYELARELGLSNKQALDLCSALGIGVKSHSSSIEEAQADRVRRKADREGLKKKEEHVENPPVDSHPTNPSAHLYSPASSGAPTSKVANEKEISSSRPSVHAGTPSDVQSSKKVITSEVKHPAPKSEVEPNKASQSTSGSVVKQDSSLNKGQEKQETTKQETSSPPRGNTNSRDQNNRSQNPRSNQGQNQIGGGSASPTGKNPPRGSLRRQGGPSQPNRSNQPPGRPGPMMGQSGKPIPPPPGGPPRSATGRPIPPPPGGKIRNGPPPSSSGSPQGSNSRSGGQGGPPRSGQGSRPTGEGRSSDGRSSSPRSGPPRSGPPRSGSGYNNRPSTGSSPSGNSGGYNSSRPSGSSGAGAGFGGGRPSSPSSNPRGGSGSPASGGGNRGSGPTGTRGGSGPSGRGGRPPQRKSRRRRKTFEELEPTMPTVYTPSSAPIPTDEVIIERGSTAQEVGPKMYRSAGDVVRFLLLQGEMVTGTQSLSDDMIELFAAEIGATVRLVDPGEEKEAELQAKYFDEQDEDEDLLEPRAPVITVMGHVDHGKTLLLDRIRQTHVVEGEAGGITQHIGAYQVEKNGHHITFIDTPGHEAFTAMRARGAKATDIVVLVVAADDGVMPQTIEAINHAKAAEVPIVVAMNKIDRADADPNRVMQQLSEHGLVPEQWGGDTITVEISALQNMGIEDLLEQLIVVAEVEELKVNPTGRAKGVVLEANLDVGKGPVATVLVQKGTLSVGDSLVAGAAWGKVRALINDKGVNVKTAGPSVPVQILGFTVVPNAGDEFRVTADTSTAREIAETREQRFRFINHAQGNAGAKLEDIFEQIQRGETATLNLILKADVQGSLEALTESIRKLEREEVKLNFVHRAVGGITENDVQLAAASNGTIIGFNVRPDRKARTLAETQDVDIRLYEIIYKAIEDIESAMVGMIAPEFEEVVTGEAEVREVFRVPRVGSVAGCYVRSGVITRGSKVRFLREGVVIWKGTINSLKRFKEDVREVQTGFECGIGLSDFQDLKDGDIIETFEEREVAKV